MKNSYFNDSDIKYPYFDDLYLEVYSEEVYSKYFMQDKTEQYDKTVQCESCKTKFNFAESLQMQKQFISKKENSFNFVDDLDEIIRKYEYPELIPYKNTIIAVYGTSVNQNYILTCPCCQHKTIVDSQIHIDDMLMVANDLDDDMIEDMSTYGTFWDCSEEIYSQNIPNLRIIKKDLLPKLS